MFKDFGFQQLTGDVNYLEHGGVFMYETPINIGTETGQHNAFFVVQIIGAGDVPEHENPDDPDVWIQGELVSPGAAGAEARHEALQSYGLDEDMDDVPDLEDEAAWCEILQGFGASALAPIGLVRPAGGEKTLLGAYTLRGFPAIPLSVLEEKEKELWEALKLEAMALGTLVGFTLDRRQNGVGQTGWEALKNDQHSCMMRMRGKFKSEE